MRGWQQVECANVTVRKLAWACGGFALGAAGCFLFPWRELVWVFAAAAVLAAALLFRRRLMALRLVLLAFGVAAGAVYTGAYDHVLIDPVMRLDGETICVSVTAEDRLREYYAEVSVDLPGLPEFRARLYDYDAVLPELSAGDVITGEISFVRSDVRYGERDMTLRGDGIVMLAYPAGELTVEEGGGAAYLPRRLCAWLEDMVDSLFSAGTAPFEKALLTGERGALYQDEKLYDDITRAGLAHIVAVSGMHVSFIAALLMARPGRRRAVFIGVPAVVVFMLMTGMPHSVVRAGLMYFMLILAPLFRREGDSMTSLMLSLGIIVLSNPAAVFSVSLQLSYAAMAGILLMSRPLERAMSSVLPRTEKAFVRRALHGALTVAAMSLAATVFTTPLIAWYFGYFSTYSIIANLLTYPVMTAVFCLGYPVCMIGAVLPELGRLLAGVLSVGVRYILACSSAVAALPGSVVYTANPVLRAWIPFAALLFAAAWLMRGKGRMRAVFPTCLSVISLCAVCIMLDLSGRSLAPEVTVLDVGQGQSIVMLAGDSAVVVDCGCGGTAENAGDTAGAYLRSKGVSHIDALVLTHLHDDHANGAVRLMRMVDVGAVYLAPGLDDSDGLHAEISSAAAEEGTKMVYITQDSKLTAGRIELDIFAPLSAGDANESGLIVMGGPAGFRALITGDAGAPTERELVDTKDVSDVDMLVVGHHGGAGSTTLELIAEAAPDYAVVSCGWNSYGHPTEEAMARAIGRGAELYRTDLSGSVSFYPGG